MAVVAGNEEPDFNVEFDPRFKFISLSLPIVETGDRLVAARLDKIRKYSAAWDYANSICRPAYAMKLDADDLVSSRLVDWLANFGGEPGYLIKHGFIWKTGARYLIHKIEYFDRLCGSCLLIRRDYVDKSGPFLTEFDGVPFDEASSKLAVADQCSLIPGSGTTTLLRNNCHQRYAAQFAHFGHKLASIPFHSMVYRVNNADSITQGKLHAHSLRMWLGSVRRTRLITPSLRREFMLK